MLSAWLWIDKYQFWSRRFDLPRVQTHDVQIPWSPKTEDGCSTHSAMPCGPRMLCGPCLMVHAVWSNSGVALDSKEMNDLNPDPSEWLKDGWVIFSVHPCCDGGGLSNSTVMYVSRLTASSRHFLASQQCTHPATPYRVYYCTSLLSHSSSNQVLIIYTISANTKTYKLFKSFIYSHWYFVVKVA